MSAAILTTALLVAQLALALAIAFAVARMIRGPRAQDRILALDSLYVNCMLLLVTLGMRIGSSFFSEASLIIAMLGFVSTVALSKFLMRGEVIE